MTMRQPLLPELLGTVSIALLGLPAPGHAQSAAAPAQPSYAYATNGILDDVQRAPGAAKWKLLVNESNLGGQELEMAEVTLPAGHSTQNHMHGPVEVLYVLSGTYDHEVNGKRYRLTPGMVGIVRPGDQVRHLANQGEDVKLLVLWAPGGEAARAFATAQGTTPAPVPEVPATPEANPGQARVENAGRSLIGTPAPRFRLETIDGEAIDLGELYGKKAVYLKFWATWCVPCRQQMPHFEKTYQTAGDNLAVIAVNVGLNDSREAIEAYRRELGITMPIVIDDGRLAEALNLTITPQHVVIGRDGRIEYVGFLADERLDTALRAAAQTRARAPEPEPGRQWTAAAGAEPPDRLPDLSAVTLDGRTFRTRDPSDRRPTVFVFISSWCESYLARQRPEMGATCRQVREQVDILVRSDTRVRWLGVAIGLWATEAELRDYAAKSDAPIPFTLDEDGAWFRAFGVTSFPTVVIADAGGKVVKRIVGFDPSLAVELDGLF